MSKLPAQMLINDLFNYLYPRRIPSDILDELVAGEIGHIVAEIERELRGSCWESQMVGVDG